MGAGHRDPLTSPLAMRIDSPANPRIKEALRAVERGERLLLEGSRALGEALAAGVVLEEIFFEGEEGLAETGLLKQAAERGTASFLVSSRVLGKLSDLPSARGIVALAEPPRRTLAGIAISKGALAVLLDGVQDPTNVGAIVRSAEAFGAAGVVLTPGSADPFSPKAVRASALSALRVPIATGVAPGEAADWAARQGATLAGAEARGGESPGSLRGIRPLVLVIGAEGRGISPVLEAGLALRVTIPLAGRVDSLNAAVAAGVLPHAVTCG